MENLELHLQTAKLFADTCSLMHWSAPKVFLGPVRLALVASKTRLIIPTKVLEELKRVSVDQNKVAAARNCALEGLRILDFLRRRELIDLRGDENDPFADAMFQTAFTRWRTRYPLSLLTQDVKLMVDILKLQVSNSVAGIKPITIWEIDGEILRRVDLATALARLDRQNGGITLPKIQLEAGRGLSATVEKNARTTEHFGKALELYFVSPTRLPAQLRVERGSVLQGLRTGTHEIGERIGSGGEGEVYATLDDTVVAKIYSQERLTRGRYDKLRLMVTHSFPWSGEAAGICWPLDLLTDKDGVFRGFTMRRARGKELAETVFIRPVLEEAFPHWSRPHLVQLCLTILRKIKVLHRANVLIGDLNQYNILVENEESVYLVDTDSYQVEGYPCPVENVYFTPPELQGADFSKVLRGSEHEAFAIATLLFMILHAGKQPYAQLEGGMPWENIRKMQFPYRLKEKATLRAPEGPWKYIWSNLTYKLKEAFYETFTGGRRRSVDEWILLLESYAHALSRGFVSSEMFPTEFKPITPHAQLMWGTGEDDEW